MIAADTPNLWNLKHTIGQAKTKAIIVCALVWLAELVNIERTLNEVQLGECVNDILEQYGYLKVEELKYIFKQALKSNKLYGRLDYSVVMNWVSDYCVKRNDICEEISNQEALNIANIRVNDPEAISYAEYLELLKQRACNGDVQAKEKLNFLTSDNSSTMRVVSREGQREKDLGFFKWMHQTYLKKSKEAPM